MVALYKRQLIKKSHLMKQSRMNISKRRLGTLDLIYILFFLLILGIVISTIRLDQSIKKAEAVLSKVSYLLPKQQIIDVPVALAKEEDPRTVKLRHYLVAKASPLAPYSELLISEADKYDIGWTKLVSISMIESDFGKKLPVGSHNAWGLGGSRFMYFSSWEDSIHYASKLIGVSYKRNEAMGIKAKYCPESDGCNPEWANLVVDTSEEILEK